MKFINILFCWNVGCIQRGLGRRRRTATVLTTLEMGKGPTNRSASFLFSIRRGRLVVETFGPPNRKEQELFVCWQWCGRSPLSVGQSAGPSARHADISELKHGLKVWTPPPPGRQTEEASTQTTAVKRTALWQTKGGLYGHTQPRPG